VTPVTPVELCCMTVRQASLPELISLAGEQGFGTLTATPHLIERAGTELATLRAQADGAGVSFGYIDGLASPLPGTPGGVSEERCFALAEGLGAPAINLVHFGGSPVPFDEMADVLGRLAQRAGRRGLRILIEFLPDTGIPDLPVALDLVRRVGADNLRVMLDTWHLARTGGGPEHLVGDAPALIGGIQVSDRCRAQDAQPYVPMSGRYLPGEGELPLMDILAPVLAAQPDLPVGVEVINDELKAMPAAEAARVAGAALAGLLGRVRPLG
jgi:sugar phosphate isomerase/epimerase